MPALGPAQVAGGLIFVTLGLVVVGILITVARHAGGVPEDFEEVKHRGYAIRRVWLWVVIGTAAVTVAATLFFLPYASAARQQAAIPVQVTGMQYSWQISQTTFRAGDTVDFMVTSTDVNHGFGLYAPDGSLVAQVQAMPHYVNHLVVTLDQPGAYTIRCLEYCGLAHDVMMSSLTVTKKGQP